MRYKLLGRSGLRVSELCLGTMTFMDELSWGTSKLESERILDVFLSAGGNFVDTSNSYGPSEALLGEFLRHNRDHVVIGTKYGGSGKTTDPNLAGSHRKSLFRSVEGSLSRLQTDYLDLLWLNSWDFMTPVEELIRALDDVIRQGKVLYVGIANTPAWLVAQANTLADLRGLSAFVAIQVRYNLLARDAERELIPMANWLDLGVTAWTPLASGFLTGKYDQDANRNDNRRDRRRLDDPIASLFVDRNQRNCAIVEQVVAVAREIDATPAHVAINWLRQRQVTPILGARTAEQLAENLRCLDFTLSPDHMQRLNGVSATSLGYPHEFLASQMVRIHTYGGMFESIDGHRRRSLVPH